MEKYKEALKITVLGRSNSGKTSLINAILGEEFSPNYFKTTDVIKTNKQVDNLPICIMDTPDLGQNPTFKMGLDYRDTKICIICVDLAKENSTNDVDKFVKSVDQITNPNNPTILLVGTKVDLISNSKRQAKEKELIQKVQASSCQGYFITSAKENINFKAVRNELEILVKQYFNKKSIAEISSTNENFSRPNSFRLSNSNSFNNSTIKQESNQRIALFWHRHKYKIINGIIIGAFVTIAITLAIVLPVAPLLAGIGLVVPFTGLALTATLAGIGAALGLVAGSVVAGIKAGIEALVKFFQHKEKKQGNVGDKDDQSNYSRKASGPSQSVSSRSNVSPTKEVDLPQNFSSPIGIGSSKEDKQTGSNTASRMNQPELSSSSPS